MSKEYNYKMSTTVKQEHVKDIDFRSHEERQATALADMKQWYEILSRDARNHPEDNRIQGQLTMLSSVLWLLLPKSEYEKLRRIKP